jgi:peptidoglycan/xylan/chitin deacetylase (PgdA/CDA1 family)
MFIRSSTVLIACLLLAPSLAAQARRVAVTIDDLPTASVLGDEIGEAERVTRALVAALVRYKVPAIGFVNERKLQPQGPVEPRRVALLQHWLEAGLDLGNHTYSHRDLHTIPLSEFQQEVLDGEKITRELLLRAGKAPKYFRHPFLHTGRNQETRARLESFLAKHGYRVAPVTIDNYDYIFAAAYDRARARADEPARRKIASAYLAYMEAVTAFYEEQSVAILGREFPQTLLLHANALNAATFDDLARMFVRRGYQFVRLDDALADPAYASADSYYGPAGITWLHRWAISAKMPASIFAGEPLVPQWIERAAQLEQ